MLKKSIVSAAGVGIMLAAGLMGLRAQERVASQQAAQQATQQMPVADPSCTFFGPDREKFTGRSNAAEQARLLEAGVLE